MTGIEVNNEFLDLPPNVLLQIVRNGPYFNNDSIDGEYSLPISLPMTEKNYRLIGFTGNHYKNHIKQSLPAKLHADAGIIYIGTLVINSLTKNINQPYSQITASIFTFGISSFWQQVQIKKMTDLQFGGPKVFNWTTNNPTDGSDGFWQHIHTKITGSSDYTFAPILDEDYGTYDPNVPTDIGLNKTVFVNCWDVNKLSYNRNVISLCPQLFLNFVFQQLFNENGWTVDGDVFNDPTFSKIVLISYRSIFWATYANEIYGLFPPSLAPVPRNVITLNLNQHISATAIATFLINIKNYYGLAYVFDNLKKHCSIKFLKNVVAVSNQKDLTKYLLSNAKLQFDSSAKIYGVSSSGGADSFANRIPVDGFPRIPGVKNKTDLPDPSLYDEGTVCLVYNENAFYNVYIDYSTNTHTWQFYSDNVSDYLPAGYTDTIESAVATLAMRRRDDEMGFPAIIPQCSVAGNWFNNTDNADWGIITMLYHGLQLAVTGSVEFPLISSINIDNRGNKIAEWANVFDHSYGDIDDGLYILFWKKWFSIYQSTDVRTYILNLPLHILFDLKWEDVIMLINVPFLIQQITYNLPYDGMTTVNVVKINL